MATADDQFYREYILDHYKNPRNYGRLENPDISHEEDNPLCGDVVGMDFRVRDGVIDDIRFHGRGCAISQASASLLTERLKGSKMRKRSTRTTSWASSASRSRRRASSARCCR
jgi:nitrogen fixation NifU-like protein